MGAAHHVRGILSDCSSFGTSSSFLSYTGIGLDHLFGASFSSCYRCILICFFSLLSPSHTWCTLCIIISHSCSLEEPPRPFSHQTSAHKPATRPSFSHLPRVTPLVTSLITTFLLSVVSHHTAPIFLTSKSCFLLRLGSRPSNSACVFLDCSSQDFRIWSCLIYAHLIRI